MSSFVFVLRLIVQHSPFPIAHDAVPQKLRDVVFPLVLLYGRGCYTHTVAGDTQSRVSRQILDLKSSFFEELGSEANPAQEDEDVEEPPPEAGENVGDAPPIDEQDEGDWEKPCSRGIKMKRYKRQAKAQALEEADRAVEEECEREVTAILNMSSAATKPEAAKELAQAEMETEATRTEPATEEIKQADEAPEDEEHLEGEIMNEEEEEVKEADFDSRVSIITSDFPMQ
eukprot:gene20977-25169_t